MAGLVFDYQADAGVLAGRTPAYEPPEERGCVGLLTAGTSDIPVAEEAALVATHMGCRVERGYDVGVAGLHRLVEPLSRILEAGPKCWWWWPAWRGLCPRWSRGWWTCP